MTHVNGDIYCDDCQEEMLIGRCCSCDEALFEENMLRNTSSDVYKEEQLVCQSCYDSDPDEFDLIGEEDES